MTERSREFRLPIPPGARSTRTIGAALRALAVLAMVLGLGQSSGAHEVRPAHLTITETSAGQYWVLWKVPAMGQNQRVAIDPKFAPSVLSDQDSEDRFSGGASIRTWRIRSESGLGGTDIRFDNLPATMIDVLVQVTFLDGRYHTSIVRPSYPVFPIPSRAGEATLFLSYLTLGVEHIWFGWDHLMFVLGLTLLVTDRRRLLWAVTGFTIAHSITLSLAMLDIIRVPGPPVEAIIALSIVLLAVENVRAEQEGLESLAKRSPWLVSVAIGLIHGLGFAGALSEYGLPAHAKFVALFSFNLGVELGQVAFILAILALAAATRKFGSRALAPLRTVTAGLIGVVGAFWFVERFAGFFV